METHANEKSALVIGLGASGKAAALLLRQHGIPVIAIDGADTPELARETQALTAAGVRVVLGAKAPPPAAWRFAVVSPGVPCRGPLVSPLAGRGVPVIGELELGCQYAPWPNVAITGTNGKTTPTGALPAQIVNPPNSELFEVLLNHAGLRTRAAGNIGYPVCSAVQDALAVDFMTLEISSFQLETIDRFHPTVAVLLNITPDHLDRYDSMDDYRRAKAAIFRNQLAGDHAVIQSDAQRQIETLGMPVRSQLTTFSALDARADLSVKSGWIVSRIPKHPGRLLDLSRMQLAGPHNAENLMAALAVGLLLEIPLDKVIEALARYRPAPHRCERVAECGGVHFINDSKATNVDAVRQALLTVPHEASRPNVWLIAGGKDKGFAYDELGPLLRDRSRGAFLIGETREKIRSAWSRFIPCTLVNSLLEAVTKAASRAESGDVVLFSPSCSSFDMFQNYQHRGEVFREAVHEWIERQRLQRAVP